MLRGLIPRLRDELVASIESAVGIDASQGRPLSDPFVTGQQSHAIGMSAAGTARPTAHITPSPKLQKRRSEVQLAKARLANRYWPLRGLRHRVAFLNDPEALPPSATEESSTPAGSAPAWTSGLMAWVGGSIAG
jgi:hypothetical protein